MFCDLISSLSQSLLQTNLDHTKEINMNHVPFVMIRKANLPIPPTNLPPILEHSSRALMSDNIRPSSVFDEIVLCVAPRFRQLITPNRIPFYSGLNIALYLIHVSIEYDQRPHTHVIHNAHICFNTHIFDFA